MPNPEIPLPKPLAAPPVQVVYMDDRPVMVVGTLGFGLSIPLLSGLYGAVTPRQGLYWVGTAGFIVLAAAIWLGNRWLLFKQREHLDWFNRPPVNTKMSLHFVGLVGTAQVPELGVSVKPMLTSSGAPSSPGTPGVFTGVKADRFNVDVMVALVNVVPLIGLLLCVTVLLAAQNAGGIKPPPR